MIGAAMGEMYSERPVACACAECYEQHGPHHNQQFLDSMPHGIHQGRLMDSGDTGCSPHHINVR